MEKRGLTLTPKTNPNQAYDSRAVCRMQCTCIAVVCACCLSGSKASCFNVSFYTAR